MKIIDRVVEFIKYKKFSLRAFETSVGISNGYISKQHKSNASVGGDIIEKIILKYPELNPLWLLTGKGPMIIDTDIMHEPDNEYYTTFDSMLERRISIIVEAKIQDIIEKLNQRPTLDDIRSEIIKILMNNN